jgi:hypothetical protein
MLIEQIIGTTAVMLIERPLRFGSTEPRPVNVGLLGRLLSLASLLKSLQINYVSHPAPYLASETYVAFSRTREMSRWMNMRGNPRGDSVLVSSKNK